MVHEFERCGTGAALGAIDHDEIGRDAGLEHRLDHGKKLPRVAHAKLEACRLAPSFLRPAMNCISSIGVPKAECRAGEMQSWSMGTSRMREISRVTLAAGNTPPWSA